VAAAPEHDAGPEGQVNSVARYNSRRDFTRPAQWRGEGPSSKNGEMANLQHVEKWPKVRTKGQSNRQGAAFAFDVKREGSPSGEGVEAGSSSSRGRGKKRMCLITGWGLGRRSLVRDIANMGASNVVLLGVGGNVGGRGKNKEAAQQRQGRAHVFGKARFKRGSTEVLQRKQIKAEPTRGPQNGKSRRKVVPSR